MIIYYYLHTLIPNTYTVIFIFLSHMDCIKVDNFFFFWAWCVAFSINKKKLWCIGNCVRVCVCVCVHVQESFLMEGFLPSITHHIKWTAHNAHAWPHNTHCTRTYTSQCVLCTSQRPRALVQIHSLCTLCVFDYEFMLIRFTLCLNRIKHRAASLLAVITHLRWVLRTGIFRSLSSGLFGTQVIWHKNKC